MECSQIIQNSIGEGGQQVVVEEELSGSTGETGRQLGGGERCAATVHTGALTGARTRTC